MNAIVLNDEQRHAVDTIHEFLDGPEPFLLLEGFAGTGKSTCVWTGIRESGVKCVVTAPTNKATKVLRQMCAEQMDGVIPTRTIYSLLGLTLSADGEVRVITTRDGGNQAGAYVLVVVDEAFMLNQNVFRFIKETAMNENVKFLFMGDPAQLPPVKEDHSPVAEVQYRVLLTKVMRHDNQILTLATHIRRVLFQGETLSLKADNDENGGVFLMNYKSLRRKACEAFTSESYREDPGSIKLIAWRNVAVTAYNDVIREAMYGQESVKQPFMIGERVVVCQPIKDFNADEIVMTTDEEGTVEQIEITQHPVYKELTCWHLSIDPEFSTGNGWVSVYVIHKDSERAHRNLLDNLSNAARTKNGFWSAFWDCKESIHDVRPCHAITAHRAQGSTYTSAFVDSGDILLNKKRKEALQCLYVACTRPSRILAICG